MASRCRMMWTLADSLSRLHWLVETIQCASAGRPATLLDAHARQCPHSYRGKRAGPPLVSSARDPDGFAPHLRTAADGIDAVLEHLGTWPPLSPKGAGQAARRAHSQYEDLDESFARSSPGRSRSATSPGGGNSSGRRGQSVTITQYKGEFEKEIKDSLEQQISATTQNYRANLDELEETLMTAVLGASRDLASLDGDAIPRCECLDRAYSTGGRRQLRRVMRATRRSPVGPGI